MKLLGAKSESIPIASPDQHKNAVDWSLKTVFNPPGSCQIFKKHGFSFSHYIMNLLRAAIFFAETINQASMLSTVHSKFNPDASACPKGRDYPTRANCSFQGKDGQVVLDQIRTVDKSRLVHKLGEIDSKTKAKVLAVIAEIFAP